MDKGTVKMVKSLLRAVVKGNDKKVAREIYHKSGGKSIVESRFRRQYCLRNTKEFLA